MSKEEEKCLEIGKQVGTFVASIEKMGLLDLSQEQIFHLGFDLTGMICNYKNIHDEYQKKSQDNVAEGEHSDK